MVHMTKNLDVVETPREEAHVALACRLKTAFVRHLAFAAAQVLQDLGPISAGEREEVLAYLQDATSLYSPLTAGLIERYEETCND